MGRLTTFLFAGLMAMLAPAVAMAETPVRVDGGLVAGKTHDGVSTWFGIPYAAAPVGDLRWRAPQPVKAWDGVRQATAFSPVCRQTVPWVSEPQSEDCLFLNIWAPAAAKKLPVMVWLHGGGFFGGSGSQGNYDGSRLARHGVILVTLNYRLGVFGFFAHPELSRESPDNASGNEGIRDQMAALAWVRRNIAAFGGDPERVTVFGESAGAESVAILVASPQGKGLFQRAIAESGNFGLPIAPTEKGPFSKVTAEQDGVTFAKGQGAMHIADLRKIDADTLIHAAWSPHTIVDGYVLREDMTTTYRHHRQNQVPILVGWNADEGKDLAPELFATSDFTAERHAAQLQQFLVRDLTPQLERAYPGRTDAEAKASIFTFTSDYWGWRMWHWAMLQKDDTANRAYLYYYVHSPAEPLTPCGYGCHAGHGAEIPFVYDLLDQDKRPWTAEDRQLSDRMVRYWTNFAATGNPNVDGLPAWTAFDGNDASIRRLGSDTEIEARGKVPDFQLFEP